MEARISSLANLLNTKYRVVKSAAASPASQYMYHAGDYTLPANVDASIATIFGLHGLPLPARTSDVDQPGSQ